MIPEARERSCGIAAFRVKGMDAPAVADYLFKEHRIFTVATVVDGISVVRVTPHLYNTPQEMALLAEALRRLP
jgi:selenocysteine lyase/cysteine desulfurase